VLLTETAVGFTGVIPAWLGGWRCETQPDIAKTIAENYCNTLKRFYFDWMNGNTLYYCLAGGESEYNPTSNPYRYVPFPTHNPVSVHFDGGGWYTWILEEQPLTSHLRVIGHQGLTRASCEDDLDSNPRYSYEEDP